MAAKKQTTPPVEIFPLLKTVEQMSKISGIGEHKLRELMDTGEIEFVQNGNRRLLCENAIWDWYTLAGIGASLGLSMNFEAVTARYVDVRLERKQEVLDAYHAAVHPKPKQARQTTPKQEKQTPKRKAPEMTL